MRAILYRAEALLMMDRLDEALQGVECELNVVNDDCGTIGAESSIEQTQTTFIYNKALLLAMAGQLQKAADTLQEVHVRHSLMSFISVFS